MNERTPAAIRRGQWVIRMVSELHRLGYQRLRIMPYFYPLAWRLIIAPEDLFSQRNGARVENSPPLPRYSPEMALKRGTNGEIALEDFLIFQILE